MRTYFAAILLVAASACTESSTSRVHLPPNGGIRSTTGQMPVGGLGFAPGTFHTIGATVPGTASVVAAPLTPFNQQPASYGTGDYSITIDPTAYSGSASSESMLADDGQGDQYLVFGGYRLYTSGSADRLDQYIVIVKQSDFAVGATVPLDGVDRVAMFGSGDPNADQPDVMGAATSGTVTFTDGSLSSGGSVTANVQGDFGAVDWGGGGGGGSGGTGMITAGAYTLAIATPSDVYCDGSLAGHEADFASITAADLAFAGGAITVATPDPSTVTVDGPSIAAAFGVTPFSLADQGGGLFAQVTDQTGAGPDGTQLLGKYLAVDASSATPASIAGSVGAGYGTADGSGSCTVAFQVSLAP